MRRGTEAKADQGALLMLNLLYDLKGSTWLLRENAPRPAVLSARICRGKTIGLIGLGRIASDVARRLQGWGANIMTYSPGKSNRHTEGLWRERLAALALGSTTQATSASAA